MGYRMHVAGADGVRITRVETTDAICDYFDDPDFDDVPGPALILDDGGNAEAFIVCGDIDAFVRTVVKAMPRMLLTEFPDEDEEERLREVWKLVSPMRDGRGWRDRIDARIPASAASVDEIYEAVSYFCGGVPDVATEGDEIVVTGAGYWEWMGG